MMYKWFGNYQGASAIAASSLITGILSLIGLGLMIFLGELSHIAFTATAVQWNYFLIGTILGTVIGGTLY